MKILVCISEYYPYGSGIANVAYNVVEQLKRMDIECSICSPTGPDIVIMSPEHENKFGGLELVYFWYKVSNYFQKNESEFDGVWLHQPLFLIKKSPFKKAVITVHTTFIGKDNKRIKFSLFKKIYYKLMNKIEKYSYLNNPFSYKYTYIDNNILQEIKNMGVKSQSVFISNGVDTGKFVPETRFANVRDQLNIPHDHKLFLSVGRLISIKRPFLMLEVFKKIQKSYKNTTLLVVGSGSLLNQMKKYVSDENIPNVIISGFVEYNSLPDYYSCADYYIMTSEYEGQPLTLLEAMASGLPCIVSDIPNLNIVKDANCGVVLDFSDIEEAVRQILNYIGKDNAQHSLNARKYAVEILDWRIIAEKYLSEFKNVVQ